MLNFPKDKSVKIQFNAVIPLDIWEWEEDKSSIFIRFAHHDLGGWNFDIGPCTLLRLVIHVVNILFIICYFRDAGDGFHLIRLEMSIEFEFLRAYRNGLPYKYVVYSPRSNTIGHQFEFLHGALPYEYTYNNRLLKVPQDQLKPGGTIWYAFNLLSLCFRIPSPI